MANPIYCSRTAEKFVLRMPDGMREKIAEIARENHRSSNSEIIARLEQSMGEPQAPDINSGELSMQERDLLYRFRLMDGTARNTMHTVAGLITGTLKKN